MNNKSKSFWQNIVVLLKSKTSQSMVWMAGADLIKSACGFFAFIILARGFAKDQIGILYTLLGILMTAGQISDLGINISLVNLSAQASSLQKKNNFYIASLQLKLLLAVLIVIVGLLASPYISERLFHNRDYILYIHLMFWGSAAVVLGGHFQALLQIEGKFKEFAIIKTAANIAKLIIIACVLFLEKMDLFVAVIAYISVPVISCVANYFWSEKDYIKDIFKKSTEYKNLISFSVWIVLSQLANTLLSQVDIFMLSSMTSAEEVARYAAGQRLPVIYPVLITAMVSVLMPKVSSMQSKEQVDFYIRKSLMVTPFLCFGALLVTMFSEKPIVWLLREEYRNAVVIFQIISIHYCLSFIFAPLSLVFYQMGKVKLLAMINLVQLLVSTVGNYFLIPIYQSEGAAIMNLVVRLPVFLFTYFYLKKAGYLQFKKTSNKKASA